MHVLSVVRLSQDDNVTYFAFGLYLRSRFTVRQNSGNLAVVWALIVAIIGVNCSFLLYRNMTNLHTAEC